MNAREPDDLGLYEQRIAALEANCARWSRSSPAAPRRRSVSTSRSAAEHYGLLGAWVVLILLFRPVHADHVHLAALRLDARLQRDHRRADARPHHPADRRRLRSLGRQHADAVGDAGRHPQREGRRADPGRRACRARGRRRSSAPSMRSSSSISASIR